MPGWANKRFNVVANDITILIEGIRMDFKSMRVTPRPINWPRLPVSWRSTFQKYRSHCNFLNLVKTVIIIIYKKIYSNDWFLQHESPGTYRSRHYNSREASAFFAPWTNNRRPRGSITPSLVCFSSANLESRAREVGWNQRLNGRSPPTVHLYFIPDQASHTVSTKRETRSEKFDRSTRLLYISRTKLLKHHPVCCRSTIFTSFSHLELARGLIRNRIRSKREWKGCDRERRLTGACVRGQAYNGWRV